MKKIITYIIVMLSFLSLYANAAEPQPLINMGNISTDTINNTLSGMRQIKSPQYRIKVLSQIFLGTPYGSGTLQSNDGEQEHLVIDFSSLDCFTFLDYVESLRLSNDFNSFTNNLRNVRYKNGEVTFTKRNHFFTDWAQTKHVTDVTQLIGGEFTAEADKNLNQAEETRLYVPGVAPVARKIYYIPAEALISQNLVYKLQTGDYVGFYTDKPGLDVTHVGIIIHDGDKLYLRHASSLKTNMRVVDQDFIEYLKRVKGIIVLRPVIL